MCYNHHQGMRGGYGFASKGQGGFSERWAQAHEGHRGGWYRPPVNIEELDDRYELYLAAPGRNKSDFQVNVQGDLLTISSRKQEDSDLATTSKWTRREFRTAAFERQFLLNEKIDAQNIAARYAEGVLVVTLPKLPGAQVPTVGVLVD